MITVKHFQVINRWPGLSFALTWWWILELYLRLPKFRAWKCDYGYRKSTNSDIYSNERKRNPSVASPGSSYRCRRRRQCRWRRRGNVGRRRCRAPGSTSRSWERGRGRPAACRRRRCTRSGWRKIHQSVSVDFVDVELTAVQWWEEASRVSHQERNTMEPGETEPPLAHLFLMADNLMMYLIWVGHS